MITSFELLSRFAAWEGIVPAQVAVETATPEAATRCCRAFLFYRSIMIDLIDVNHT